MIAFITIASGRAPGVSVRVRITLCDCTGTLCACCPDDAVAMCHGPVEPPPPVQVLAGPPRRHARPEGRQRWRHRPGPVRPAYRRPCY